MTENRTTQNACAIVGEHEFRIAACKTSATREATIIFLECRDCDKRLDVMLEVKKLIKANHDAKQPFLEVIFNSEEEGG